MFCRGRPVCRPVRGSRAKACPGGHIGPPLRGYRKRSGTNGNCPETMPCPAGRDGARPLQGAEQACGGGVRLGCGHPALRKQGRWCVVTARRGRRALRVQCKWYPAYGPMWASAPTESPINHPSQPARSEASAPAAARDGRESTQGPSQKGDRPATSRAALSEAESAERGAGQIRSLPDDLRVQHGVQRSEVSAKPRPCSRRGCGN